MSNHRLPRIFGALLVLSLLSALLGSCAPQARQEINFIFMRTSDKTEPYWEEVISAFEEKNPNINVNLYIFEWTDGQAKIQEMIDQGNPPTLARVATRWVPQYMAAGLVEPVDEYLTDEFRAQFLPLFINEGAQYEGRTFGLPITVATRALYYNKTLFEKAGISSPPSNWEELREASKAVHALEPDTYGFGLLGGNHIEVGSYYYYFLWGNGGDILTGDGTRPAFNGPEGLEALTYLTQMVEEGLTQPDPTTSTRADLETAFVEGKVSMVITGPWLATRLAKEAPDLEYGLAAIPYQTTPTTLSTQDTLILFKQAQNKEAAWKFIEFLYADEYRLKYALTEGVLSEKIAVAEDPQFKENEAFAFFMENLDAGRFEPLNVKSENIAVVMRQYLQAAYRGEMTPEQALAEAAVQVQRLLFYSATSW